MALSVRERVLCELEEILFLQKLINKQWFSSVFEKFGRLLDFSSGFFMCINPHDWTLQAYYNHNFEMIVMKEYDISYQYKDPYVMQGHSLKAPDRPIRLSDISNVLELDNSEFGLFMRQIPYFHALATFLFLHGQPVGMISVHRRREQVDFDEEEMQLFGWFGRQLAHALDYAALQGRLDLHPPLATLVLSSSGQPVAVSDTALDLMAMLPDDPPFTVPHPDQPAHIWRVDGRMYEVRNSTCAPQSLLRMMQNDLWTTLPPACRLPASLKLPVYGQPSIVSIEPLLQSVTVSTHLDALHLTPRQRQVAELLLCGLLIKRIAGDVGLTEATVKEYLAAVYKKAGVHHSREFIAAMLG